MHSLIHGRRIGALLLDCISTASADQVTYNLQTYTFHDILPQNAGFNDTLSGTLTLTNSSGSVFTTYNAEDDLSNVTMSATLTMQSSSNTIAPVTITAPAISIGADVNPVYNWLQVGSLTATASGLFLSNPGTFRIDYAPDTILEQFPPYIAGNWDTAAGDDGGCMSFFANIGGNGGAATMQIFPQNLNSQPGPEFGPGSWEIAVAVPEPSSILLLSLGVMGFLARRRL